MLARGMAIGVSMPISDECSHTLTHLSFLIGRFDTLTLFEGQNYAGIDQYILDDNPSVLLGANSAIVTGISGWTLYE